LNRFTGASRARRERARRARCDAPLAIEVAKRAAM